MARSIPTTRKAAAAKNKQAGAAKQTGQVKVSICLCPWHLLALSRHVFKMCVRSSFWSLKLKAKFTLADIFQVMHGLINKDLSYQTDGPTREFLKTGPGLDDECVGPMQICVPWPKTNSFMLPLGFVCKGVTGEQRSATITPGEMCEHVDNSALQLQLYRL